MKLKKIFLLCCLTPTLFFFNSCSISEDIDELETDIAITSNLLTVDIDGADFETNKVSVNRENSLINIVSTDTDTNRSVFLTFVIKGDVSILGDDKSNPDGNVAGYLLNDTNEGYVTNTIDGILGEIRITNLDRVNNTISGTFFFTAFNQDSIPIQLQNGVFENVSLGN